MERVCEMNTIYKGPKFHTWNERQAGVVWHTRTSAEESRGTCKQAYNPRLPGVLDIVPVPRTISLHNPHNSNNHRPSSQGGCRRSTVGTLHSLTHSTQQAALRLHPPHFLGFAKSCCLWAFWLQHHYPVAAVLAPRGCKGITYTSGDTKEGHWPHSAHLVTLTACMWGGWKYPIVFFCIWKMGQEGHNHWEYISWQSADFSWILQCVALIPQTVTRLPQNKPKVYPWWSHCYPL